MDKLTHTDESGRAHMVDTGGKPVQHRIATAAGRINMQPDTLKLVSADMMKKGDVLTVAEIAGIQAAKECGRMIPLCHNITLDQVSVHLSPDDTRHNRREHCQVHGQDWCGDGGADSSEHGAAHRL